MIFSSPSPDIQNMLIIWTASTTLQNDANMDLTWSSQNNMIINATMIKVVWQKYGNFSQSMFWGIYNILLVIMSHHGVSVQKPLGDKFSPLGIFFYIWFRIFSVT